MSSDIDRARATSDATGTFETVVVPHLTAAHRLARRLMRNDHDAEDVVQEASLRAFRYFRTFTGGNSRAWLLRIVRNICLDWSGRHSGALTDPFDETQHSGNRSAPDPETLVLRTEHAALLVDALTQLPRDFHHVLVLREFADLSYRDIAQTMDIPLGTVMSRLSRARGALRGAWRGEVVRCRPSAAASLRDGTVSRRARVTSSHGRPGAPRSSQGLAAGVSRVLASTREPRQSAPIASVRRAAPAAATDVCQARASPFMGRHSRSRPESNLPHAANEHRLARRRSRLMEYLTVRADYLMC